MAKTKNHTVEKYVTRNKKELVNQNLIKLIIQLLLKTRKTDFFNSKWKPDISLLKNENSLERFFPQLIKNGLNRQNFVFFNCNHVWHL